MEKIRFMNTVDTPTPLLLSRCNSIGRDCSDASSSRQEEELPDNALIHQCLAEIEEKHNIRIIFASECSSRSIGTSHQNSDHDIAAIFVYPTDRYLSLKPVAKSFQADFPSQCNNDQQPDVQVILWESRHAFELLSNNNHTLLEVFQSPLVYRVFDLNDAKNAGLSTQRSWDRQVLDLTGLTFDRKRLARSSLSQGESNYHRFIKSKPKGNVRQKKYVHVIRKILLVEWLLNETNTSSWPPPIHMPKLLQSLQECNAHHDSNFDYPVGNIPPKIQREVAEMIKPSNLPLLQNIGDHRSLLDSWIMSRMSFLKDRMKNIRVCKEREAAIITQWDEILVPLMKASSAF